MEVLSRGPLHDVRLRPEDVPPTPEELLVALPGSSVFRLAGRDPRRTRVATGLLHGNEPSGFVAVHRFLRSGERPETDLLLIVGAVEAARHGSLFSYRTGPSGRDLNRCFLAPGHDDESHLAAAILDVIRRHAPEAVIDLHNNSGHNPAYGVSTRIDPRRLGLTSLFAPRFVISDMHLGALMDALADELPIVTIECGRRMDPRADDCAYEGLRRFACARDLPIIEPGAPRMEILHSAARVRVRRGARIGFGDHGLSGTDVTCALDIDRHNFQVLAPGTHVAWAKPDVGLGFEARDEAGTDVTARLFRRDGAAIVTAREIIPIMMTTDAAIALADCLFYAVERWDPSG